MKSAIVKLKDVADFANENGYRLIGRDIDGDSVDMNDLIEDSDIDVVCNLVGCALDFKHTKSTCGIFEFKLIS